MAVAYSHLGSVCFEKSLLLAVEFSIVKMPVPPIEQYWQNVFFSFLQALDSLRKALGLPNATHPNPHPEMKSLEQQEEELEKTVGAVMQCGRITSTISAGKNKDWSQITIHSTTLEHLYTLLVKTDTLHSFFYIFR